MRRTNLLWGVLLLAVAMVVLLRALGLIPDGIYDVITRAWPALLVVIGLGIFLRERAPYGSLIALALTGALTAGVAIYAFSVREAQERDDYRASIVQPVDGTLRLLRVQIEALDTDVELVRALQPGGVAGEFVGSAESLVRADYTEDGSGGATLLVSETRPNPFPLLEAIGRGRLRLELPPEIPLDIELVGASGTASLNLSGLAVERLNLDWKHGSALVTLPAYKPLGSPPDAVLGTLAARDGGLTLFVPAAVAARLELTGGSGLRPEYDETTYNLLASGVLETRNYDTFDIKLRYVVNVPRGQVSLRLVES